tara:strand:- start:1510 stop:2001 length:492 start_codon:yes stop_codon:yes gene_type:complete
MDTRNARTANERISETREETEYVYEEPDALHIPISIRNRFENEGMVLRWLRITLKGQDDYQNIGKKMTEGWEFVLPEEIPEMAASSLVREEGRYSGAVCRGDLALAKKPEIKAAARTEYYRDKSRNLMEAVNMQLENSSDSKMPITNNSKSSVTRGRRPSFQE